MAFYFMAHRAAGIRDGLSTENAGVICENRIENRLEKGAQNKKVCQTEESANEGGLGCFVVSASSARIASLNAYFFAAP